jgi:high affinity Mn2+ porin
MSRWTSGPSLLATLILFSPPLAAQSPSLFGERGDSRLWLGGQANLILQGHGPFKSPYEGPQSLRATSERAMSHVFTLYSTYRLTRWSELLIDVESAGGRGISDAFGLAGFTNLDVVRNPQLGSKPYLARAQFHSIISLGAQQEEAARGMLSGFARLPTRYLEVRLGKMGIVDFFDVNNVGGDSHLQFLNWTVDNNGAYDYDADTRGYSIGAVVEYHAPIWSVRGGVLLMPRVANGIKLDHDIRHARGENVEVEWRPVPATTMRFLVYRNLARMGSYRDALQTSPPDITLSRRRGRTKTGVGWNAEEQLSAKLRAFARLGWNDGRNESFAYTEVDRTAAMGLDLRPFHRRPLDKIGIAAVENRLSNLHRDYLAAGGLGFLLGDGALRYGPEHIIEGYYTASLGRGVYLSVDVQAIRDPGYNRDRGPVLVPATRLHIDF